VENQNTNIQQIQHQLQIKTQFEEEQKNEQKEKEQHKSCKSMLERSKEELGHLKIKTSHLWIKHSSSKIYCSTLGYPRNQGPGKNTNVGGGGYGTKGKGINEQGGEMYGEETLLKQIHFGSGGGGGSGGGIIELIIEQQLIRNHLIDSTNNFILFLYF
ncbi:hypothetical protein RFI_03183, partial [Reticulomyxa filosa]